jgi:HlyD family secretion protein
MLLLIISFLILAGIATVVALRYYAGIEETGEKRTGVPVVVGRASKRSVEEILRYPGTLMSTGTATIVPKIAGRVDRITVKEGEIVRRGEILVELQAEAAAIQADQALSAWNAAVAQLRKAERGVRDMELESAQASLSQAEEDLIAAERNFERSKRLYEAGTIAKANFEESENALGSARTLLENARRSVQMMEEGASSEELDMAKANAEAAGSQYELAKLQLDYARVTAPVSGIVAAVLVDEGNMVGTSTPLLAIVQQDPMKAAIQVPEKYYGRFTAGEHLPVRVSPIAYPGSEAFDGFVSSVAPVIDPGSRTFEVAAEVSNPRGLLKPGMFVNTEMVIEVVDNLLMAPATAVVLRDDSSVVFTVRVDGARYAKMVHVETGIRSDGFVAISGAISESDLIILLGNSFLEDGQLIQVVESE